MVCKFRNEMSEMKSIVLLFHVINLKNKFSSFMLLKKKYIQIQNENLNHWSLIIMWWARRKRNMNKVSRTKSRACHAKILFIISYFYVLAIFSTLLCRISWTYFNNHDLMLWWTDNSSFYLIHRPLKYKRRS